MNSNIDNLEWMTMEDNARHAWENRMQAFGEAKKNAAFNSKQVTAIRLRVKHGESAYALSREFNVTHGTIKKICRFESWKHQDQNLKGRVRPAS
jgi:phosphoribosylformylglycinamidine (FGAM) synthase-like amidotransferase family enzyme